MGEIAEMMLDGMLDFETGEYLGGGCGYPRTLGNGGYDIENKWPRRPKNMTCPVCSKKVRGFDAVHQHMKDKHKIVKKHIREVMLKDHQRNTGT